MYGLEQTVTPVSEPVSTATLKNHLRLNTDAEDSLLSGYILAARELLERLTNRQFLTATYKLYLDAFPKVIRLPKAPLQSVTSVQYYNAENNLVTWDAANYSVDTKREPGRIVPKTWFPDWKVFPVYPSVSYSVSPKIVITFTAGYTTADNVPQLLKQGILLLASHYYQQREAYTVDKLEQLPQGIQAIVGQFKLGFITNMNEPMFKSYGYEVE